MKHYTSGTYRFCADLSSSQILAFYKRGSPPNPLAQTQLEYCASDIDSYFTMEMIAKPSNTDYLVAQHYCKAFKFWSSLHRAPGQNRR